MSKKEGLVANEMGAYPCRACMRKHITSYPIVKLINDLAYAQCSNTACDKFGPYEFIGSTKKGAVKNWNAVMTHDTENSYRKKDGIDEL